MNDEPIRMQDQDAILDEIERRYAFFAKRSVLSEAIVAILSEFRKTGASHAVNGMPVTRALPRYADPVKRPDLTLQPSDAGARLTHESAQEVEPELEAMNATSATQCADSVERSDPAPQPCDAGPGPTHEVTQKIEPELKAMNATSATQCADSVERPDLAPQPSDAGIRLTHEVAQKVEPELEAMNAMPATQCADSVERADPAPQPCDAGPGPTHDVTQKVEPAFEAMNSRSAPPCAQAIGRNVLKVARRVPLCATKHFNKHCSAWLIPGMEVEMVERAGKWLQVSALIANGSVVSGWALKKYFARERPTPRIR